MPWQIINTFIIFIKLLKLLGNAVFYEYFRDYLVISFSY